jgi:hypothetical protein
MAAAIPYKQGPRQSRELFQVSFVAVAPHRMYAGPVFWVSNYNHWL